MLATEDTEDTEFILDRNKKIAVLASSVASVRVQRRRAMHMRKQVRGFFAAIVMLVGVSAMAGGANDAPVANAAIRATAKRCARC